MSRKGGGKVSIGLGGKRVSAGQHICCVFGDDEDRFSVLARYLRAGVEGGDKLLHATLTPPPEGARRCLANHARDLDPGEVLTPAEVYYPEGSFNPIAMIDRVEARCRQAKSEGFTGMRFSGETSWTLLGIPGSERFLEYEVMLNELCGAVPLTAVCCFYDARLFDGTTILDVIDIHPLVILGGQLLQNPNPVRSPDRLHRMHTATAA